MSDNILYLLSNASLDSYPDNTLTKFTNQLPKQINFKQNKTWEVGVQSIGLSFKFRNINLPKTKVPSVVVVRYNNTPTDYVELPHAMPNFHLYCVQNALQFDLLTLMAPEYQTHFYLQDYYYTYYDIKKFCEKFQLENPDIKLSFRNKLMKFSIRQDETNDFRWIFLHKSFCETFQFQREFVRKMEMSTVNTTGNSTDVNFVLLNGIYMFERPITINSEDYFGYLIGDYTSTYNVNSELISKEINVEHNFIPKLIKIQSDIIQPQILNDKHSKDLVVFSPSKQSYNDYFYYEIESVDYIPILNTSISKIDIKLVDENDNQLKLLSGHSTIIKLQFRKMPFDKRSFNIRITSEANNMFTQNQPCAFKVQIPISLQLDRSWKVALNSISCPTEFSTLLNETHRFETYVGVNGFTDRHNENIELKKYHKYSSETLLAEINLLLSKGNYGKIELDESKFVKLTMFKPGAVLISETVSNVLNLSGPISTLKDGHKLLILGTSGYVGTLPKIFMGTKPIDINYYRPSYFIVYSNIVKNSIIGSNYSKILRVIPFQNVEVDYKIFEFKQREFYELSNDSINVIEIYLKTHDGRDINFLTNNNVIVNLEFSNFVDY
jgi:hypothetical protein